MLKGFDLKKFRTEILKMSQIEMARAIGMRQDKLSRYEDKPESIQLDDLMKISRTFGISLDQLFEFEKVVPQALDVKNNWTGIKFIRSSLLKRIDSELIAYDDRKKLSHNREKLDELKLAILNFTQKPKIVFLGRSDSGKSTMINALIGENKIPTNWTPTTSIVIYIKHLDDKPHYIKDDVWILKNDSNGALWDDKRLYDEKYTSSVRVAGGAVELLSSYGTSQGEQFKKDEEEISAAVLFVDSPILKNCDILDVPGYTGGRPHDNKAAEYASYKADVLIYLAPINSFIGMEDPICIKRAMENISVIENKNTNELPLLANLFVVGTQAHIVKGQKEKSRERQIEEILDDGCNRLFGSIDLDFWNERKEISGYEYNEESLRKRFFSYTTDVESLRSDFDAELKKLIEEIPILLKNDVVDRIKDYARMIEQELNDIITEYKSYGKTKMEATKKYEAIMAEDERVKFEFEERKRDVESAIEKCKRITLENFEKKYNELICETTLIKLMKEKNISNQKKDREKFMTILSDVLDSSCKKVIKSEAVKLNDIIEEYTKACQSIVMADGMFAFRFSAKRAFAAGISGTAVLGALAYWASMLGNLGGYIIVTKTVSALAAIGIHVGGAAAAVKFVAAFGGPVAWGIGVAAAIACATYVVLGGGWKKQFAKCICNEFEKQNVLKDFKDSINRYWKDTKIAFGNGANKLKEEYELYKTEVRSEVENFNANDIAEKIADTDKTIEIIENLFK